MQSRYYDVRHYIEVSAKAREYLSKPLGRLYTPDELHSLKTLLRKVRDVGDRVIASVGDRVTKTVIDWGVIPDIAVIDCMERRRPVNLINTELFKHVYYVDNIRGYINMAIKDLVEKVLKYKPVLIKVGGEEDLVGIPIIYSLGYRDVMIYGQPGKGVVYVEITERLKSSLDKILFG